MTDIGLLVARLGIVCAEIVRSRMATVHPRRWAARYVPASLLACLLFGLGTMRCIMSPDSELASLAVRSQADGKA